MAKKIVKKPFPDWQIPGVDHDDQGEWSNKVVIAFDTEYKPTAKKPIKIGDRIIDVVQRRLTDIISLQLAFNYQNIEPVQYFIHREKDDDPFDFYDILRLVKKYLTNIGVYKHLKKWFQTKVFYFELWGFWLGTDLSTLRSYEKILTESMSKQDAQEAKKNPSKLVSMNINTLFTSRPLKLSVKDKYRHVVNMFPKQRLIIRDMIKLAPGKSNLAMLGEMIGLPKLDTEELDRLDKKPEGYYKTHMDELWTNRPDDFAKYAMTDTVITALYGQFIIDLQDKLMAQGFGKFHSGELKTSIGSIVSNIVGERNMKPADWIIDIVYKQLMQFKGVQIDIMNYLFSICDLNKNESEAKYNQLFKATSETEIREWLRDNLNFDAIRKGYNFYHFDSNDEHHKHLVNDITTRIDAPLAKSFDDAVESLHGGYNIIFQTGVIRKGGVKADLDLSSA